MRSRLQDYAQYLPGDAREQAHAPQQQARLVRQDERKEREKEDLKRATARTVRQQIRASRQEQNLNPSTAAYNSGLTDTPVLPSGLFANL